VFDEKGKSVDDMRLAEYRRAAEALRDGQYDIEISIGPHDEIARLGEALRVLAIAMKTQSEQAAKLAEISRKINEGLLLEDVLDQVYDSFFDLIPYDRIGFALLDRGKTLVRAHWARSEATNIQIPKGYSAALAGSSLEEVVRSRRPRILGDLEAYLQAHPDSDSTGKIVAEGMRSSLTCPLLIKGQPVGFLFFSSMQKGVYTEEHQNLFIQIAGQLALTLERSRLYEELLRLTEDLQQAKKLLEREASRDSLTDLWNRRAILDLLKREMARSSREDRPVAAVMIDIDNFKMINDRIGHLAGDQVLLEVTRRVGSTLRSADVLGRIGGEEFLIILSPCDGKTAFDVMERARRACAASPVSIEAGDFEVTVSLGAAVTDGADVDLSTLLKSADDALYRAKNGGRNRSELAAL
jgi:diguanylate cyclase (GGDEF)-like protein